MPHVSPRLARIFGLALVALVCAPGPRAAEAPSSPRVTMITDSVGGALYWLNGPRESLASGFDFDLETKTCRKLVEPGCGAYGDPAPPSALDTIHALGSNLAPILVVDVGYNDRSETYAAGLDEVMRAAVDAGAQHVIWLTLEEREGVWAQSNAQIWAATARWPQLTVADWASVSAGQPWYVDEAHLNWVGGTALGAFVRPFLIAACGTPCATPPARFCGLALTSHGFDPVQAAGLTCSAADGAIVRIEAGQLGDWFCAPATDAWKIDCRRGFTSVQALTHAPTPVARHGGLVSLADWSFRLRGHTLQAHQGRRRWLTLGRAPFCPPVAPREVLAALPLHATAGGCFGTGA
jgi:hypothetical protein